MTSREPSNPVAHRLVAAINRTGRTASEPATNRPRVSRSQIGTFCVGI